MVCTAAYCVFLKDNTGGRNSLDVTLMSCFMVVTSNDVFDFFGDPDYLLVFLISCPLSKACL